MARSKEDLYEVERIVKAKVNYKRGKMIQWKYFVKWKDYDDKDNTWEPAESFETSPSILKKFWRKVDLGDRDPSKGKYFSLREEVTPRDDTWSDGDAEDAADEQNESASPKVGTKRTSGVSEASPKRKRGRPSKADKEAREKEMKHSKAEEKEKSNGGEGRNGGPASRRNSRRLSAKPMINSISSSDASLKFLVDPSPIEISSSDSEAEVENFVRTETTMKRTGRNYTLKKKRKTIIESDEEDSDRESEVPSSHDGSLFSGEDSDIQTSQNEEAKVTEAPAIVPLTKPVEMPKAVPPPPVPKATVAKTYDRHGRPLKAKVKMLDDPAIGKAIEERMARVEARVNVQAQASVGGGGGTVYRPTLLTADKGKLVSQRSNVSPTSPWVPSRPSSRIEFEIVRESILPDASLVPRAPSSETDGNNVLGDRRSVPFGCNSGDLDAMDTSPDFAPSANIVGNGGTSQVISSENLPVGPAPTADELLRLSGVNIPSELPDFAMGEVVNEVGSTSYSSTAVAGVTETNSSGSQELGGATTNNGVPAWKESNLFTIPTPRSILQRMVRSPAEEIPPSQRANRLSIPLRLNQTTVVPVVLKDVDAARNGPSLFELLRSNRPFGPPGKLFRNMREVFRYVDKAGSSARIVPDDNCTDEQHLWFSKLVDELENDSLFIVDLAGHTFIICSSKNGAARMRLLVKSNTGISRTLLIQHVPIIDEHLFNTCVTRAEYLLVPTGVQPARLVIPFRLGPDVIVPVVMKETTRPIDGAKMEDLLTIDQLDGPAGKLHTEGLVRCLISTGSVARITPDELCSEEQHLWYSRLVDELMRHKLFLIELGGRHFVLSSATDYIHTLFTPLFVNAGPQDILMELIVFREGAEYEACRLEDAQDLQLN